MHACTYSLCVHMYIILLVQRPCTNPKHTAFTPNKCSRKCALSSSATFRSRECTLTSWAMRFLLDSLYAKLAKAAAALSKTASLTELAHRRTSGSRPPICHAQRMYGTHVVRWSSQYNIYMYIYKCSIYTYIHTYIYVVGWSFQCTTRTHHRPKVETDVQMSTHICR